MGEGTEEAQRCMDNSDTRRISELKEKIFILQINEGRLCARLARSMRDEKLKGETTQALKATRAALATLTKELATVDEWSRHGSSA